MAEPGTEERPAEPGQLKLVLIIAADSDADRLIKQLIARGYPATKVSSTGGFLRRGSATVLSGVEGQEIEDILAIVRSACHARTEYLPVQTLPFFGEGAVVAEPVEVRLGGAIVFVMNVERFERT